MVDLELGERAIGDRGVDLGAAGDRGEVAHPAQQTAGDPGRAAGAPCDLDRALAGQRHAQNRRAARDDRLELGVVVEVQAREDAEAIAQGRGQKPGARGRADQGERRQVDPDRARGRAFADHQIELELLERRVEDLLNGRGETMDLVDEQDVARLQVGELGGEVAGAHDHRPRGQTKADPELGGDDLGERGLAKPGRPGEQNMVERLAPLARGVDEHPQVVAQLGLADELIQTLRAQRQLRVRRRRLGADQPLVHGVVLAESAPQDILVLCRLTAAASAESSDGLRRKQSWE